jgi:hypothetical protein
MTILSEMERKFAAAYVANGGIAARAAVAAGYSPVGARQLGSRLLERFRVREEIGRLTNRMQPPRADQAAGPPIEGEIITITAAPLERDVLPAEEPLNDDQALAASLTPAWMIARAMRGVMMCSGEIPQQAVKMVQRTDEHDVTKVTAVQVKGVCLRRKRPRGPPELPRQGDRRQGAALSQFDFCWLVSNSSVIRTMSAIDKSVSDTPAAIAGDTRRLEWMRAKLYQTK